MMAILTNQLLSVFTELFAVKDEGIVLMVCQVLKRMMGMCSEVCKGFILAKKKGSKTENEEFHVCCFYVTLILAVNIFSGFPAAVVLSEE